MTIGVLTVWTEGDSNSQGCRSSLVSPNPSWAIRVSSPSHTLTFAALGIELGS